jgi:hypothetical protein
LYHIVHRIVWLWYIWRESHRMRRNGSYIQGSGGTELRLCPNLILKKRRNSEKCYVGKGGDYSLGCGRQWGDLVALFRVLHVGKWSRYPLYSYRNTCLICGPALSFYSEKCGGVNEDDFGVLAVVSHYIPIGYKRFSMAGPPAFILSHCLTSGYGIFGWPL